MSSSSSSSISNRIIEKYEDSPFIKVLSFAYQSGSNSTNLDRERVIEEILLMIYTVRQRRRDNEGNRLTWDDAALIAFEDFKEFTFSKGGFVEEKNFDIDEWLSIMHVEREEKEERRQKKKKAK